MRRGTNSSPGECAAADSPEQAADTRDMRPFLNDPVKGTGKRACDSFI
jgi:hypothetical protein